MLSRPAIPAPPSPRPTCARCRRPLRVCYCAALPRLPTRTRVVILQHPREEGMPIGTARMASLCLPAAELHVGLRWGDHAPLAAALADPARPPILLYPGAGARDILADPPRGPVTLVVVDGTWSQAKTLVRLNPLLQALPRYAFTAPEPTQYRIRREPDDAYVSTIEALMHVLGALEGEPARFRALLDPLRAMVDAQLACQAAEQHPRKHRERAPRTPRWVLPPEIHERFDDLVVVAAEANAWPRRPGEPSPPDELVHWTACRVGSGERFDHVAAPAGALSPTTCQHIGLSEAALRAGTPRAELFARFAAFLRPSDVVCSWGHYGPRLFLDGGGALPRPIDLRDAAKQLARRKVGPLEHYAATLGPAPAALAPGRAGRRLALLAQVVSAWRAL